MFYYSLRVFAWFSICLVLFCIENAFSLLSFPSCNSFPLPFSFSLSISLFPSQIIPLFLSLHLFRKFYYFVAISSSFISFTIFFFAHFIFHVWLLGYLWSGFMHDFPICLPSIYCFSISHSAHSLFVIPFFFSSEFITDYFVPDLLHSDTRRILLFLLLPILCFSFHSYTKYTL